MHALQDYITARGLVTEFPGWTGALHSTALDNEMGLLVVHRERILDALRTDLE